MLSSARQYEQKTGKKAVCQKNDFYYYSSDYVIFLENRVKNLIDIRVEKLSSSPDVQDIVNDILLIRSKLVGYTNTPEILEAFNDIEKVINKLNDI